MIDYIAIAASRVADTYPIVVYAKPQLDDLPAGAILGTWAYSVPHKVRFILARDLEMAPGVLPGDVSRAWVRDEYNLPIKRRKAQLEQKPYALPLHARRGKWGDCAYVDISGAYLKILSFGFDVEYIRSKYIAANPRAVPYQIASKKFCYAIGVSMSSSQRGNMSVVGKEGTVFTTHPFNMFSNPCLYYLACDVLNAIASEVLHVFGLENVYYVNTDGFIVRQELVKPLLDIIESWCFTARVKHQGETEVYGVGSWKVGTEHTARRDFGALNFTCKQTPLDDLLWLKARIVKWSDKLPSPELKGDTLNIITPIEIEHLKHQEHFEQQTILDDIAAADKLAEIQQTYDDLARATAIKASTKKQLGLPLEYREYE